MDKGQVRSLLYSGEKEWACDLLFLFASIFWLY